MSDELEREASKLERSEKSSGSNSAAGWVGLAAAIAGAASGTPAGQGIAKGLSETWKAQINNARERDQEKAARYEEALFTMRTKGQEERREAHKARKESWDLINELSGTDTYQAAITWGKMHGISADELMKTMSARAGYEVGKDGTKLTLKDEKAMKTFLKDQYAAFNRIPEPTHEIDNYATLQYRDVLDRGGLFSGIREFAGVRDVEGPMTPYAGASQLRDEIFAKKAAEDAAASKAEAEAKVAYQGEGMWEVTPGAKALAGDKDKTPVRIPTVAPEGADPNQNWVRLVDPNTGRDIAGADGKPVIIPAGPKDMPPYEFKAKAADAAATYRTEAKDILSKHAGNDPYKKEIAAEISAQLDSNKRGSAAEFELNQAFAQYATTRTNGSITTKDWVNFLYDFYGIPQQPSGIGAASEPPPEVPDGWIPMIDSNGNKAWVSPDKKEWIPRK